MDLDSKDVDFSDVDFLDLDFSDLDFLDLDFLDLDKLLRPRSADVLVSGIESTPSVNMIHVALVSALKPS